MRETSISMEVSYEEVHVVIGAGARDEHGSSVGRVILPNIRPFVSTG